MIRLHVVQEPTIVVTLWEHRRCNCISVPLPLDNAVLTKRMKTSAHNTMQH